MAATGATCPDAGALRKGAIVAQLAFVQVIVVAAVIAVVAQCCVYPVRRLWGMAAAYRVLRWSLGGFVCVAVVALVWGAATGDLARGIVRDGLEPGFQIVMFIGFTMFVSYFMASRYLADELERARTSDGNEATEG